MEELSPKLKRSSQQPLRIELSGERRGDFLGEARSRFEMRESISARIGADTSSPRTLVFESIQRREIVVFSKSVLGARLQSTRDAPCA